MAVLASDTPAVLGLTPKWVIAYKPAGWLSIPPTEIADKTEKKEDLLQAKAPAGVLSAWLKERYGPIWVVHRLDRETSGVILFARSAEDHRLANTWFQNHEIKKAYDCIAQGVPARPVLRINVPIRGQPSVTQVEVQETYAEGFLARAVPVTGRRHQIRIHLASQGHPLWGDRLYKGPTIVELGGKPMGVARVALHAARLELPTGEVYESYWPRDLKAWVERLRADGKRI